MMVYGFVIAAVITDWRFQKISNRLIVVGLTTGLIRRLLLEGAKGLFIGAIQISLPVIILYPLFLIGALGAGDIKLFSLIGGFVNFKELTVCVIAAFVIGAVWSLLKLIFNGFLVQSVKQGIVYLWNFLRGVRKTYPEEDNHTIPFSLAVLGGLIVAGLC